VRKQKRPTFGLSRTAFVVCDSLKRMWREAHPQRGFWRELERPASTPWRRPAPPSRCRKLKVRRDGAWLRIGLPSGPRPVLPAAEGARRKDHLHGREPVHRQWSRIKTYGGKLAENVTQAARATCWPTHAERIEPAGYEIVLLVHDELLTETPCRATSWKRARALTCRPP
jgi:DNA polymerase